MIAVKDDSQKQINLIKESDMEKEHFVETKDGLTLLIVIRLNRAQGSFFM